MRGQRNIKFEISTLKPIFCYFEFIFIVTVIITPLKGRRVQMNLCLYFPYLMTDFGEISCWRLSTRNDTVILGFVELGTVKALMKYNLSVHNFHCGDCEGCIQQSLQ